MRRDSVLIRAALLVSSALLTWLGLPGNFSFWPLLAVSLVPLFFLLNSAASWRQALLYGFVAGLVFYPLQLYWIVTVLQQYGGLPWIAAAASALLLVVYMSFYPALFGLGFHVLRSTTVTVLLPIAAAAWWVGLDWIRSWFFSGFPWMDIGYGLWSEPRLLQAADLVGHHGYTFLIVLLNLSLFVLFQKRIPIVHRTSAALVPILLCLAIGWYGEMRWKQVEELIEQGEKATVGVVQGNVEQTRKWSPEERLRTVGDYVRLSETLTQVVQPQLIVWPETALPFYPNRAEYMEPVLDFANRSGVMLLTGAPWFKIEENTSRRQISYFNGALLVEPAAGFAFGYYKSHLVPYGEYVPLKKYMPFIAPLVEAAGDFSPGTIEEPLRAGPIAAGILICFESIFPDLSRAWVNVGANLLVNLTNDAWYGKSSAPYQSWAMTVYRSVETRRALVRSANTGISGFLDPLGRVGSRSGLFVEWAQKHEVALLETRTLFVRGGYLFAPMCAAFASMIIIMTLIQRKRKRSRR